VLFALALAGCTDRQGVNVTIRAVCGALPDTSAVYLTGDDERLGAWNPGALRMTQLAGGTWERTVVWGKGMRLRYKFTRGGWESEALNLRGVQYNSEHVLEASRDTTVTDTIRGWLDRDGGVTQLVPRDIRENDRFFLSTGWRYHPGDDTAWAARGWDDSTWEICNTAMGRGFRFRSGWDGIGWFRLHLVVDSALAGRPLALGMPQAGASEVYLDGAHLCSFGRIGASGSADESNRDRNPVIVQFSPGSSHVIAVRYADREWRSFTDMGLTGGFTIFLGEPDRIVAGRVASVWEMATTEMVFTTAPLVLGLFHLFLFVFYPRGRENLFYGICMLGFAGITFGGFHGTFQSSSADIVALARLIGVSRVVAVVFGLLTLYALSYARLPRRWMAFAAAGALIALWTLFTRIGRTGLVQDSFMLLAMADMIYSTIRRRGGRSEGAWIVGVGFAFLIACLLVQLLVAYDIIPEIAWLPFPYLYGALALSASMSLHLSWRFARTNRNLEQQLVQVRELSARTLEQERQAKEKEIERRILAADNARKTQELEEARNVQMSMLPKALPDVPSLDIAVYMKTATEVGGDYYDFHLSPEGVLTVALGDATGHGAKAGTMVAVSKGLFHELAPLPDIRGIFERYTTSIRQMNLGALYMAMAIVKIRDHTMSASCAGMPPILIYRAAAGTVEELPLKGMPLGAFARFPYATQDVVLGGGDAVLLMSDGFPEMFNPAGETLDYPKAKEAFARAGALPPRDIIDRLVGRGAEWAGGRPLEDDVTFVVLKAR